MTQDQAFDAWLLAEDSGWRQKGLILFWELLTKCDLHLNRLSPERVATKPKGKWWLRLFRDIWRSYDRDLTQAPLVALENA